MGPELTLLPGVEDRHPMVIAGPCSAETEEQAISIATQLTAKGVKIFRAGIWKPRIKPGGFEGIGVEGLAWLKEMKKEIGMYIPTEVVTAKRVHECLKAGIDVLRVGARTTTNPFVVQEIAGALKGAGIPVLVENPVNPGLELWIGALERTNNAGLKRLGVIHHDFSSHDKKLYRNLPQWHISIESRRHIPELPIFCDPSHIGRKRESVAPLCQQAMDLNFDGLIVKSHRNPNYARSDVLQRVTPSALDYILSLSVIRKEIQITENLNVLRKQIDECDNNIIQELAKRIRVTHETSTYKKRHDITVLQTRYHNETLEKRGAQGEQCGMSVEFVKVIFEAIHEESVRQQMEIINKQRIIHIMRILILGTGKMGSFFTDILSFQHETAVFDVNPHQLWFVYNIYRFTTSEETKELEPELVINAATVKYTLDAFHKILPVLPKGCIPSDIASVKTGLKKFYKESGFCYASTHPMFGSIFASLSNLSSESAIIINEGDHLGRVFFKDLYNSLNLSIFEYTFDKHDETVAYSLSIPFVSTSIFATVMKHQEAPGTIFKKYMAIAKGLLSEDDCLLQEILFNPRTSSQAENICTELKQLLEITTSKDAEGMKKYLTKIREKIK